MLPEISTQQTRRSSDLTRYWRRHGKVQERYTRRKQLVVPHAAVLIARDMRLETRGIQVARNLGNVPFNAPLVELPDHQQNRDAAHRARSLADGRASKAAARASTLRRRSYFSITFRLAALPIRVRIRGSFSSFSIVSARRRSFEAGTRIPSSPDSISSGIPAI